MYTGTDLAGSKGRPLADRLCLSKAYLAISHEHGRPMYRRASGIVSATWSVSPFVTQCPEKALIRRGVFLKRGEASKDG